MAQFLKDDVEREIKRAALQVFAAQGYGSASMASIAREAGISTGNVYRYFANKEGLLAEVVPDALPRRLLTLLRARIRHAGEASSALRGASDTLLAFSLEHRLALVVLLGRNQGTPFEGFEDKVRGQLEQLAIMRFRELYPGRELPRGAGFGFALRQIYRGFIATMVSALAESEDPTHIRDCVDTFGRYHLAGLIALFNHEGNV